MEREIARLNLEGKLQTAVEQKGMPQGDSISPALMPSSPLAFLSVMERCHREPLTIVVAPWSRS